MLKATASLYLLCLWYASWSLPCEPGSSKNGSMNRARIRSTSLEALDVKCIPLQFAGLDLALRLNSGNNQYTVQQNGQIPDDRTSWVNIPRGTDNGRQHRFHNLAVTPLGP
eukprot:234344-Pyramimonas_sp.AAC.1